MGNLKRFNQHIYFTNKIAFRDGHHVLVESDDGTLFAGEHRTKIYAEDLPEWYIKGTFYRCEGYLSAKGITDMVYRPNLTFNHFLRDDFLYISYDGKITVTDDSKLMLYERYSGYNERVYGATIIDVLIAAREYSGYDISKIVRQIEAKRDWLKERFPTDYEHEAMGFDSKEVFSRPVNNGHPPKFYKITLDDYFNPAFVSFTKDYYGTLDDIAAFIEALPVERYEETKSAFWEFLSGNSEATHTVAYQKVKIVEPVKLIKTDYFIASDLEWDFQNAWGFIYKMKAKTVFSRTCVIQTEGKFVLCYKPRLTNLIYRAEGDELPWSQVTYFWGHPGVLSYDAEDGKLAEVSSSLYFGGASYEDVKAAVSDQVAGKLNYSVCFQDIFGDG